MDTKPSIDLIGYDHMNRTCVPADAERVTLEFWNGPVKTFEMDVTNQWRKDHRTVVSLLTFMETFVHEVYRSGQRSIIKAAQEAVGT